MRINTAFILCAGFGKRLNPLTLDTPKPLIKFKNISVLETCINLIESLGIQQIALNTFYLKEQISNFINLVFRYNFFYNFDLKVEGQLYYF